MSLRFIAKVSKAYSQLSNFKALTKGIVYHDLLCLQQEATASVHLCDVLGPGGSKICKTLGHALPFS